MLKNVIVSILFVLTMLNCAYYINAQTCNGIDTNDPSVCSGVGACEGTDLCICDNGYYGANCETTYTCFGIQSNDPLVCNSQGGCTGTDTCSCGPDYSGSQCEIPSCAGVAGDDPNVCMSQGSCTSLNTCTCDFGYYSDSCTVTYTCGVKTSYDPTVCNGNGACINTNECECTSTLFNAGTCIFDVTIDKVPNIYVQTSPANTMHIFDFGYNTTILTIPKSGNLYTVNKSNLSVGSLVTREMLAAGLTDVLLFYNATTFGVTDYFLVNTTTEFIKIDNGATCATLVPLFDEIGVPHYPPKPVMTASFVGSKLVFTSVVTHPSLLKVDEHNLQNLLWVADIKPITGLSGLSACSSRNAAITPHRANYHMAPNTQHPQALNNLYYDGYAVRTPEWTVTASNCGTATLKAELSLTRFGTDKDCLGSVVYDQDTPFFTIAGDIHWALLEAYDVDSAVAGESIIMTSKTQYSFKFQQMTDIVVPSGSASYLSTKLLSLTLRVDGYTTFTLETNVSLADTSLVIENFDSELWSLELFDETAVNGKQLWQFRSTSIVTEFTEFDFVITWLTTPGDIPLQAAMSFSTEGQQQIFDEYSLNNTVSFYSDWEFTIPKTGPYTSGDVINVGVKYINDDPTSFDTKIKNVWVCYSNVKNHIVKFNPAQGEFGCKADIPGVMPSTNRFQLVKDYEAVEDLRNDYFQPIMTEVMKRPSEEGMSFHAFPIATGNRVYFIHVETNTTISADGGGGEIILDDMSRDLSNVQSTITGNIINSFYVIDIGNGTVIITPQDLQYLTMSGLLIGILAVVGVILIIVVITLVVLFLMFCVLKEDQRKNFKSIIGRYLALGPLTDV